MLLTAGLRPQGEEGEKQMRFRIVLSMCAVLALSVGVATSAAAPKPKPSPATQQLCESFGGTYSTKANSSFFRPLFKKQGVVWTCNGYGGGSTSTQALVQACFSDGGKATSTLDSGFSTCWRNA